MSRRKCAEWFVTTAEIRQWERMRDAGLSRKAIAQFSGRCPATIARYIGRSRKPNAPRQRTRRSVASAKQTLAYLIEQRRSRSQS